MLKATNENIYIKNNEDEKNIRDEFKNYCNIDEVIEAYKKYNFLLPFDNKDSNELTPLSILFRKLLFFIEYKYLSDRTILNNNDFKLFRDIKHKFVQLINVVKNAHIREGKTIKRNINYKNENYIYESGNTRI